MFYGMHTYENKYCKYPTDCQYDEGFLISDFIDENLKTRSNDNLYPHYFLYEMDEISLNQQLRIIKSILSKYSNKIALIVFSGNKSYHVLVPCIYNNCDKIKIKTIYKELWTFVGKNIFGEFFKYQDMQNNVMTKFCRLPNGLRVIKNNDVIKQELIYDNMINAKSILNNRIVDYFYNKHIENEKQIKMINSFTINVRTNNSITNLEKLKIYSNSKNKYAQSYKAGYDALITKQVLNTNELYNHYGVSNWLSCVSLIKKLDCDLGLKLYNLIKEQHPSCLNINFDKIGINRAKH